VIPWIADLGSETWRAAALSVWTRPSLSRCAGARAISSWTFNACSAELPGAPGNVFSPHRRMPYPSPALSGQITC
jgi:hypothetical protein